MAKDMCAEDTRAALSLPLNTLNLAPCALPVALCSLSLEEVFKEWSCQPTSPLNGQPCRHFAFLNPCSVSVALTLQAQVDHRLVPSPPEGRKAPTLPVVLSQKTFLQQRPCNERNNWGRETAEAPGLRQKKNRYTSVLTWRPNRK